MKRFAGISEVKVTTRDHPLFCQCYRCLGRDLVKAALNRVAEKSPLLAERENEIGLYNQLVTEIIQAIPEEERLVHDHLRGAISQLVRDRNRYRTLLYRAYKMLQPGSQPVSPEERTDLLDAIERESAVFSTKTEESKT